MSGKTADRLCQRHAANHHDWVLTLILVSESGYIGIDTVDRGKTSWARKSKLRNLDQLDEPFTR